MSDDLRILINGQRRDALPPDDRGLAYGDGLFETMRVHRDRVPWWAAHWQRLALGAQRLGIPLPDESTTRAEAESLLAGCDQGVLKLLLTRGGGARGYAPPPEPMPTLVLSRHALPAPAPVEGLVLRWCSLRLSRQPLLAGLKHCNRLEQVLARAEWRDPQVHEGLMLDGEDRVIGATAGNVFASIDGRWLTPRLDHCGVAGILRGWLLGNVEGSAEADLSATDIAGAEALFLCNAVRGILPVTVLGAQRWRDFTGIETLRRQLAVAEPAFAARN